MQEATEPHPEATSHPPVWPQAIIGIVIAIGAAAWLCVWRGWLTPDWGFWALSTGTLVIAIVAAIWRSE